MINNWNLRSRDVVHYCNVLQSPVSLNYLFFSSGRRSEPFLPIKRPGQNELSKPKGDTKKQATEIVDFLRNDTMGSSAIIMVILQHAHWMSLLLACCFYRWMTAEASTICAAIMYFVEAFTVEKEIIKRILGPKEKWAAHDMESDLTIAPHADADPTQPRRRRHLLARCHAVAGSPPPPHPAFHLAPRRRLLAPRPYGHAAVPCHRGRQTGARFFHRPRRIECIFVFEFSH